MRSKNDLQSQDKFGKMCLHSKGEEDAYGRFYNVVGIKSFEYVFGFHSVCYTTFSFDGFCVWCLMMNVWKVMAAVYNVIL